MEHQDMIDRAIRHGWQVDGTGWSGTYMVLITRHGAFFLFVGWLPGEIRRLR